MSTNEYMKNYMAARRETRRAKLVELAGGACQRCESTEDLQFDHIDRTSKKFELSGAALDKKWQTILDELAKCQLLCSECHQSKTSDEWHTGSIEPWNKGLHGPLEHGSVRMYSEKNCRCAPCRKAKSLYRNKLLTYTEVLCE